LQLKPNFCFSSKDCILQGKASTNYALSFLSALDIFASINCYNLDTVRREYKLSNISYIITIRLT
jgi:hypothetical protein